MDLATLAVGMTEKLISTAVDMKEGDQSQHHKHYLLPEVQCGSTVTGRKKKGTEKMERVVVRKRIQML